MRERDRKRIDHYKVQETMLEIAYTYTFFAIVNIANGFKLISFDAI